MIRSFWFSFGIGKGYPLRLLVAWVNPVSWSGSLAEGLRFRKHFVTIYPRRLAVRHNAWDVRLPPLRSRG